MEIYRPGVSAKSAPPPGRHIDYMVFDDVEDGKEREVGEDQDYVRKQALGLWQAMGGSGAPVAKSGGAQSGGISMLDRLKHFHVVNTVAAVESLVELAAYGRSLKHEYETLDIPVPKWLTDNLRAVQARAKDAYKALQEEKVRRLEMEIEELRSKEEKKAQKEQELAALREALGMRQIAEISSPG